ncbi:MAG TPA: glycosyltransferase family 2 protein [Stellaceae bacterium]|nr:glycosyltransferase family 2 protein [Stellaceae bacterium]
MSATTADRGGDPNLSIVVPCYNEAAVLRALYTRLAAACAAAGESEFEIVLINDGSRDNTWEVILGLCKHDRRVTGVDLSRNHGHQLALSAGLALCRGRRVLVIDADLQDPPELLPEMMRLMDDGADVVYGQRRSRAGEGRFKTLSATGFYRVLQRLADVSIPVDTGDFRLMRREVVDLLNQMPEQHRFIRGMVSWLGFNQVALPYDREARGTGETGYTLRKMVRLGLDAITGFSTAPLRFATYLACSFLVIAIMLAIYDVFALILGGTVRGWASMFLALLVFSSVQLFCLGMLGEYVGRIYIEARRRPLFIVKELYRAPGAAASRLPEHGLVAERDLVPEPGK